MSTSPSSPPPPTNSGTGKYLLLILLLGGGIAGLFAFRHLQEGTPPPTPSASTAAPLPTGHASHDDPVDIPPPPSLPDATPDTGSTKGNTAVASTTGGDVCGQAKCGGAMNPELSSALSFRAKTAHKCYDEALAQDSTLKGQVVINVKVGSNGTVCAANVESNDLQNPGVAPCIASRFRQGARLPSPTGGCVEANVPMRLLPPH